MMYGLRRTARNFNPRPPRGERLPDREEGNIRHIISIHALQAEGDLIIAYKDGHGK